MKRTLIWLIGLLVLTGLLYAEEQKDISGVASFRGVVGVNKAEAGIGDTITVRVRELDGWLVGQMRSKFILGEKYFTADQFRRWLGTLEDLEGDIEGGKAKAQFRARYSYGHWIEDSLAKKGGTAGTPSDLFDAFDRLRQDIRQSIYLVIGNSRLRQLHPQYPYSKPGDLEGPKGGTFHDLLFTLKYDGEDKAEWDKLARGIESRVPVSVRLGFELGTAQYTLDTLVKGWEKGTPLNKVTYKTGDKEEDFATGFALVAYDGWSMTIGLLLVIVAFAVFLCLAATTDLVRDPDLPPRPDGWQQFNLARCQMAFWFFLFTTAYVFLWVVKGQTDTLTDQCLTLLGISTGTTLGSAFISKSFGPKGDAAARPEIQRTYSGPIQRFFYELLSDGEKLTFYRFQMLVWSLVLGMVFIKEVCLALEMPKFGANELALMGISAGTYIGFRFPEAKSRAGDSSDVGQKRRPSAQRNKAPKLKP